MLVNSQVTRILFDAPAAGTAGNSSTYNGADYGMNGAATRSALHATAVEVSSRMLIDPVDADSDSLRQAQLRLGRLYLRARKSSLLQERSTHLRILQLSGIGPAAILKECNISVAQDLIGVGNNLQDHCMVHIDYGL